MRGALATLIAAMGVVGATGCGSGGTVDSSAVADAATATANAGTAKVALTGSVSRDGQHQSLSGTGEVDLRTGGARMTVKSGPLTIEEILQHFVIYIHFTGAADEVKKAFHTDKPWIKIDIEKAGKSAGIDISSFGGLQSPDRNIDYLRAVGDVKKVGQDTVRGVKTTHYHTVVDLRRYPSLVPAAKRAAARTTVKRLIEIDGQSKLPVDVWVDARHRVRREHWVQRQNGAQAVMTIETYDFGSPVDIAPPPASDTEDLTEKVQQQLQPGG